MVKTGYLILMITCSQSCDVTKSEADHNDKSESNEIQTDSGSHATIESDHADTINLAKFWIDRIEPFMELEVDKIKNFVEFPLQGEWGYLLELNKDPEQWTETDFYANLEKIFTPEIRESLRSQNWTNATISHHEQVGQEIVVSASYSTMENEQDYEGAIILRYKSNAKGWTLYCLQVAG